MKALIITIISLFATLMAAAQIDTTSYPEQRRELREFMRKRQPGGSVDCKDFIAVGPKGDISFSQQQWQEVQKKEKLIFKSFQVLPGTEIIRIYDGNMAVVNFVAAVGLVIDGRDINIKVRRIEVYHKTSGSWCRVAGQGTEVDENLFPVAVN